MARLRIALAQINPTVGDLDGNLAKIVAAYDEAEAAGCDIVAFPELAITGYPPEDLVLKPGFVADNKIALGKLAARTRRCAAVVGFVDSDRDLYNAAAVCANGDVVGTYRKRLLPNYAVFDEARYFTPGDENDPYELYVIGGVKVGVSICEDVWSPTGPLAHQAAGGAELNININGSPFHAGKMAGRERMLATRAADASCALVYVNQVCGQDELVFDGGSMVFDAEGTLIARAAQFVEELMITDVDIEPVYRKRLLDPRGRVTIQPVPHVAGVRAAGRAARHRPRCAWSSRCRPMPSCTRRWCSARATTCARTGSPMSSSVCRVASTRRSSRASPSTRLAPTTCTASACPAATAAITRRPMLPTWPQKLGIDYRTIAIEPAFAAYLDMTAESFGGRPADLTEENLQSRIRGTTLMALSNKFGWMVLTTGNKSEMAVGYFTIYGDSVGGYGVIKDVLKTRVYDLCRYVNAARRARDHQRERHHQAAVGRAATRPARRPEPAAVRGARPHPASCTSRTIAPRPRSSSSVTTRRWFGGSPGWSTSTSTSAASARRGCGSASRRSARTAACRSPTATAADLLNRP